LQDIRTGMEICARDGLLKGKYSFYGVSDVNFVAVFKIITTIFILMVLLLV